MGFIHRYKVAAEQPEQSFSAFPFTEVCNRNLSQRRDFPHLPKDGFQWTIKILSHNREKGTLQLLTPKVPRESWELLLPRAAVRRQAELPWLPLLTLAHIPRPRLLSTSSTLSHLGTPFPYSCPGKGLFLKFLLQLNRTGPNCFSYLQDCYPYYWFRLK